MLLTYLIEHSLLLFFNVNDRVKWMSSLGCCAWSDMTSDLFWLNVENVFHRIYAFNLRPFAELHGEAIRLQAVKELLPAFGWLCVIVSGRWMQRQK